MAERLSFEQLQDSIVIVLYEFLARDIRDEANKDQIREVLGNRTSNLLLIRAIQKVYNEAGLVAFREAAGDHTSWHLTDNGLNAAARLEQLEPVLVESITRYFDGAVPASDRFVTTDDNNPEHAKGIEAAKAVVSEAADSNSFKELFADPEDAKIVLSDMNYGISLLEKGKAAVGTVQTILIDRLKWIQEKLPEWTGSASVKVALEWLLKLTTGS